jgi:hypothetical protein
MREGPRTGLWHAEAQDVDCERASADGGRRGDPWQVVKIGCIRLELEAGHYSNVPLLVTDRQFFPP